MYLTSHRLTNWQADEGEGCDQYAVAPASPVVQENQRSGVRSKVLRVLLGMYHEIPVGAV
jgi:hypothetical protein